MRWVLASFAMIEPEPLRQVNRTWVIWRGKRYSYFSGCDYFRLSSHPAVLRAAREGLKRLGLNVAASRLTTGNHALYGRLETELADFFGAQSAVLVPAGYLAPLAAAQALAGHFSHALVDEQSHPALREAATALDCPVLKFTHRDPADFGRALTRCGRGARPIALTDGMFPIDGAVAPLREYLPLLPADGGILVDDAHGAGLLGAHGRGTPEAEGVGHDRIVHCISLSKALGVFGGAVLGSRELRSRIISRSRVFAGGTPLPLPLAGAVRASLRILNRDRSIRKRLTGNVEFVKSALRETGWDLGNAASPIIPLEVKSRPAVFRLRRRLLAARIYPPLVHYPGTPAGGCFRFVISSEHTRAQLGNLVEVLLRMR